LITVLGSKKVHIAKAGRAVKTALVSSNLPASERKEENATSLLSHLETKGQKSATVGLERLKGKPKYVKGRDPFEQPMVEANISNLSSSILIGIIMDLSKLTLRPEHSAKFCNIPFRCNKSAISPFMKMTVSSAYCSIGKS